MGKATLQCYIQNVAKKHIISIFVKYTLQNIEKYHFIRKKFAYIKKKQYLCIVIDKETIEFVIQIIGLSIVLNPFFILTILSLIVLGIVLIIKRK